MLEETGILLGCDQCPRYCRKYSIHGDMPDANCDCAVWTDRPPVDSVGVDSVREALEELLPTFYGMLCKEWGHPNEWPESAQGRHAYDKARAALTAPADGCEGVPECENCGRYNNDCRYPRPGEGVRCRFYTPTTEGDT